jgi:hypothetical protein
VGWRRSDLSVRVGSPSEGRTRLSYRLGAPDAVERVKPVIEKAKAKSDGEDLLTPLVEKAANGIATTATAGGR